MIKAILYDLDGVLVDATEWHYESLNAALKEVCGFVIKRDEHISTFNGIPTIKKLEILDLGCGGGLVCESLAKLGCNVTGIDFVENNIKAAKLHASQNNLKINYYTQDIDGLSLKKKYDLIILFEVLEHIDNWDKTLLKIKKFLKKGGLIILSTINRNIVSNILAIKFAENVLRWVPKNTHD